MVPPITSGSEHPSVLGTRFWHWILLNYLKIPSFLRLTGWWIWGLPTFRIQEFQNLSIFKGYSCLENHMHLPTSRLRKTTPTLGNGLPVQTIKSRQALNTPLSLQHMEHIKSTIDIHWNGSWIAMIIWVNNDIQWWFHIAIETQPFLIGISS